MYPRTTGMYVRACLCVSVCVCVRARAFVNENDREIECYVEMNERNDIYISKLDSLALHPTLV